MPRHALTEARWLVRSLMGSMWAVVLIRDWFAPLCYTEQIWLYLMIAAAALFLAIEGWRHAHAPFPAMALIETILAGSSKAAPRDWSRQGGVWAEQIRAPGLAGDPDIDLAAIGRLLGTHTAYLSRARNEGPRQNVPTFINGVRCHAVMVIPLAAQAVADGTDPVLDAAVQRAAARSARA